MVFQRELLVSRPQLLRSIDQKEFVELLLPPSSSARIMTSIDRAAGFAILTTGLAGAGSLAMVASGFATLTAPIAVPMSAAIIAPMAIAYLYKAFANPAEPRGCAAGVAFEACPIAHQGKIPALAASLARKSFQPRLAALLSDRRPLGGSCPLEPAEFRFDFPFEIIL